jgi:hypothetical protein
MLGSGQAGLVEVLDVPEHLRDVAPEGLAALSFLTDNYHDVQNRARTMASDVTVLFGDVPGVNLFFCTMGGVPIEFMGGYAQQSPSSAQKGLPTSPAKLSASTAACISDAGQQSWYLGRQTKAWSLRGVTAPT